MASNEECSTQYLERIIQLEIEVSQSDESIEINDRINRVSNAIKSCMPDNKKRLMVKLHDYYTELMILHEEYFYKKGADDSSSKLSKTFKSIFRRFNKSGY